MIEQAWTCRSRNKQLQGDNPKYKRQRGQASVSIVDKLRKQAAAASVTGSTALCGYAAVVMSAFVVDAGATPRRDWTRQRSTPRRRLWVFLELTPADGDRLDGFHAAQRHKFRTHNHHNQPHQRRLHAPRPLDRHTQPLSLARHAPIQADGRRFPRTVRDMRSLTVQGVCCFG